MEKEAKKLFSRAKDSLSKAKRTYTCRTLKEVITAYRACTSSAEEQALVKKESAHIRDLFKEGDTAFRRRNVAKLLFFHMNGYPTDFGHMECLRLAASPKFADKRVGVLGLTVLVDERASILMLMTNGLKADLLSDDPAVTALALTVLGDIATPEMLRDLLPELVSHLRAHSPYLVKKAALAATRAVRKLPLDETLDIWDAVPDMLAMRSDAVHLCASTLIVALVEQAAADGGRSGEPSPLPALRAACLPVVLQTLRDAVAGGKGQVQADADGSMAGGVRNPFLQVQSLTAVRALGIGASRDELCTISDVLVAVATSTDASKLAGASVMYEMVRTALALNTTEAVQQTAATALGQFLAHKDTSVRYVALQEMASVVTRGGACSASVREQRATILACVQEKDPSIQARAVALAFAIADRSNVVDIAGQLLVYVRGLNGSGGNGGKGDADSVADEADPPAPSVDSSADGGARVADAATKLAQLAVQFSPSSEWHVDTLTAVLLAVDVLVSEVVVSTFLAFLSAEPAAVQAYAARTLFQAGLALYSTGSVGTPPASPLQRDSGGVSRRKPRLERVASYVLGEYGHLVVSGGGIAPAAAASALTGVIAACKWVTGEGAYEGGGMDGASGAPSIGDEIGRVRSHALSALVKLAVRSADAELLSAARRATTALSDSGDVDTQQRAVEYHALLEGPLSGVASAALAPLPPMDYAAARQRLLAVGSRRATGTSMVAHSGLVSLLDDDFIGEQGGAPAAAPSAFGGGSGVDLMGDSPGMDLMAFDAPLAGGGAAYQGGQPTDLMALGQSTDLVLANQPSSGLQSASPSGDFASSVLEDVLGDLTM
ncbi:hypothetical protein MMPV_005949 [Pyropia vietnamensis]